MATAVKKPIPTKYDVELTLSVKEAQVLFDITGKVGGNPEGSRRGLIDSIRHALLPHINVNGGATDICANDCGIWFEGFKQ